ncbi:hypothetical protein TNCV_1577401 [Trichonephila clavipes]|nr:hypothetical protein TNCV_1577401 [Trichonephila clavipes]
MTANLTRFSKTAISTVFKSWHQKPKSFSKRRNCGSNRVFQERDRRRIRRIVRQSWDFTVLQLAKMVNQSSTQKISARTISTELQSIGMHSRERKPLSFAMVSGKKALTDYVRIGNG